MQNDLLRPNPELCRDEVGSFHSTLRGDRGIAWPYELRDKETGGRKVLLSKLDGHSRMYSSYVLK